MTVDYSGMVEDLKDDLKKAIDKNKRSEEQANKTSELKKCPFCGGEAITMGAFSITADCYIMCETCGASIEKEVAWNGMTQEQHDEECKKVLINAWNNRKPLERVIERLEEEKGIAFLTLANTGDNKYDLVYDNVMAYIDKAIEIIKEEMEN